MTFFPEVFLGPLRVGATSATSDVLYQEPLLFASHYSIVVNVVTWPEDVQTIIDQVRKRYKAHDEVLDLIDTLRGQVPMALSADLARHMAEGLELHNVFTKRRDSYQEHCQVALDRLLQFVDSQRIEIDTTASGRLVRLAELKPLAKCVDTCDGV
ncbi:MAG: hypothetical protein NTX56_07440 [Proteobacteria bacterium]|nr:hypothetical protein [Pseudomonadota bacterium]